jgi:hypothetical protein
LAGRRISPSRSALKAGELINTLSHVTTGRLTRAQV